LRQGKRTRASNGMLQDVEQTNEEKQNKQNDDPE
jgi:hypothetical protein